MCGVLVTSSAEAFRNKQRRWVDAEVSSDVYDEVNRIVYDEKGNRDRHT